MSGLDRVAEEPPARGPHAGQASRRLTVRTEDWLLAAWMAVVAPWLIGARPSSAGLFGDGRPLDGLLGLIGILGVVACLATPRSVDDADARGAPARPARPAWTVLGPFVGGLLLVTLSTVTALGLAPQAVATLAVAASAVAIVVRLAMRPLPAIARRALVTPYILVCGGLFWTAIDAVTAGGTLPSAIRAAVTSAGPGVLPIAGFLVAFSAVFYAMLVYAPRQVADREGGAVAWLIRYGLFGASIALGAGWLSVFGA